MNIGAPWPTAEQAQARVLEMQAKLHRWAGEDEDRRFDDVANLVYDPAFLAEAWARVRGNTGARSAGVDGQTARAIEAGPGAAAFLEGLRADLKAGTFRPALLRCSAEDVVLRELPTDAESAPRSAAAAAALCLVYGRAAAGVLRPEQARPATDLAERALGSDDARRLRELLDQVVWVGDADHERMAELARRFCEIVGEDP
ncbi:MAG: hypothetical protein ACR2ML_04850, partial [Solirubrobacteraceae bacterium]